MVKATPTQLVFPRHFNLLFWFFWTGNNGVKNRESGVFGKFWQSTNAEGSSRPESTFPDGLAAFAVRGKF
jgi:hypothetical protein